MNISGPVPDQLPPIAVLVVEDEGVIALDMKRKLVRLGCEKVVTASDGTRAISLAEELRPDLVIMDISLRGEMNGVAAATIIHKRLSIPIIFASAYTNRAAISALDSGVPASWLVKPFSERDLKLCVQAALR